ncbi:MAG: tetratricopeptide repeat protein [Deinococcus sp.]|nr:tetratricopeptide repeat protein [Deinococcus sp.]
MQISLGPSTWEQQVEALWALADDLPAAELVRRMDALAAQAPHPALAAFEQAGARGSTGDEPGAEAFYRAALAAGLDEPRRRQATIQLASTLRNLGRPKEGLTLLDADLEQRDDWWEAVRVFRALALADLGREREALSGALSLLAGHLPKYQRSVRHHAAALLER